MPGCYAFVVETLDWENKGEFYRHRGIPIFYRRTGTGPETVLCLHGFPMSSFDYHKILPSLAERFDVVLFDMVGYGLSGKPVDLGYITFDQADVLEGLIASLEVMKVSILSHDYGNTIVQELLARQDEGRLEFEIGKICFLNGALFPETHRPILAQKVLIGPIGALFGRLIPDGVFKRNLASIFGPDTKPSRQELNVFAELFNRNNGKRIAHKLIRYMRERVAYRERWVAALTAMRQPFRFINGSADPVSGKHLVDRFRELVPHQTDIIELEGIGHFPHLETPELVSRLVVEFLCSNP
jgi:pimeloyl-ACP methyl ester carboxylesterase